MGIDFYKDNLDSFAVVELFAAVEEFVGSNRPPNDRMPEGFLLDFKEEWGEKSLKSVAAFANTFGGLLIVGVSDKNGRADDIVGVTVGPRQELKTTIASAIASNISPTPSYELWDVPFPNDASKHLCIIRIRKGNALYLITKKGFASPVFVRNENESISADAARLQALLMARAPQLPRLGRISKPAPLNAQFFVVQAKTPSPDSATPQAERAFTLLDLCIVPEDALNLRLDLAVETKVNSIIESTYPGLFTSFRKPMRSVSRGRDWFDVYYYDQASDVGMRWLVDNSGVVHFITQIRRGNIKGERGKWWSLTDTMSNIGFTLTMLAEFWNAVGYFGEGHLFAGPKVKALELLTFENATFPSMFYESGNRAKPLNTGQITLSGKPGEAAPAETDLTFSMLTTHRNEAVAVITNQLLRGLGHAADFKDLLSVAP